jgi:beta-glucosidase
MAKSFRFPKDFVFGTATASYQIEGAAKEDGRGESIWDFFSHTPGKTYQGHTGDVACDHYHRVDQDIALMKALNTTAYRFSIAWPRIIPDAEGAVNPKGLDWYSKLVDKLLAAGITPFATMYHWDLPQVLEAKYGGWRSRKTPDAFRRYAEVIVKHLGDRVKNWMTMNEMPCTIYLGYKNGNHAPGAKESEAVLSHIAHHCLLAHGHGVAAVRQFGGAGTEVGLAHNPGCCVPVVETKANIAAAAQAFEDRNGTLLSPLARGEYPAAYLASLGKDGPEIRDGDMKLISGKLDFMGLNIYGGSFYEAAKGGDKPYRVIEFPKSYPHAFADWIKIVPQALYWGIRYQHELYGYQKFYVTENGCAMDDQLVDGRVDDTDRLTYYRLYLSAAQRATADKLPLKGYFAWSLLDNFEWAEGYRHRFGLHYVDYETQKRTQKLSAKYYAACAKAKAVL